MSMLPATFSMKVREVSVIRFMIFSLAFTASSQLCPAGLTFCRFESGKQDPFAVLDFKSERCKDFPINYYLIHSVFIRCLIQHCKVTVRYQGLSLIHI